MSTDRAASLLERRRARMVDDALAEWVNWLLAFVLPPGHRGKSLAFEVWEAESVRGRSNTERSDPVLDGLIRQERSGLNWAVSVHLCICDMAVPHRQALFGHAMGYSQAVIADKIGIRQQRVSDVLCAARRLLAIDLEHRRHVLAGQRNACRRSAA